MYDSSCETPNHSLLCWTGTVTDWVALHRGHYGHPAIVVG